MKLSRVNANLLCVRNIAFGCFSSTSKAVFYIKHNIRNVQDDKERLETKRNCIKRKPALPSRSTHFEFLVRTRRSATWQDDLKTWRCTERMRSTQNRWSRSRTRTPCRWYHPLFSLWVHEAAQAFPTWRSQSSFGVNLHWTACRFVCNKRQQKMNWSVGLHPGTLCRL